ncbi:hypothetical protein LWI29_033335 [Acer saccharum]|uniref:Glycosyltransferase n=1 Tax=Acer saccharum TaxID=4024 RepID=A0AA39W7E7_ACESA|nr:hypothetical protein LWI29_033335 [Acer saccharum]
MNPITSETTTVRHVVAMPYPGRSHINSMMNLCRLLISKTDDKLILITFVVTEEWLLLMRSEPKPDNIYFASIPNVIPSEVGRAADINGFFEAVMTKMEVPFEQLLDRIKPRVTLVMCDSLLFWAVGVGNRRHIPVASFWSMSATMFSIFQHWDLLVQNKHYPVDLSVMGNEHVDYIPGVSPTRLMDFPLLINGSDPHILRRFCDIVSWVSKAQYLLFSSIYELERRTIDALRAKFCFPIYTIGPAIPCFKLEDNSCLSPEKINEPNYMHWLNCQPNRSVMYISFGSFHSVSGAQMDEIAAGLKNSGVRFLWVARGETSSNSSKLEEACGNNNMWGMLVPWCDQLRVLSHPSVGGFLTHCGWNSVREGLFAGVPLLTFPLGMDQMTNSKMIEEDWKIGWRVRKLAEVENLVSRDAIREHVVKFMDMESNEGKQMRKRVKEVQEKCEDAIAKDGSSEINIKSFIRNISQYS